MSNISNPKNNFEEENKFNSFKKITREERVSYTKIKIIFF